MSENHPLPVHNVRIKKLKSLLAIVDNSVKGGDNYLFRNLYADEDGKEIDILENGMVSCAAFVSTVLIMLELIKMPHATVNGTEKDLLANGWFEIPASKPGAVVIWEKIKFDDNKEHRHLGFCVGADEAISNSASEGFPRRHHITYNDTRKIEKILWHPDLDNG